MDEILKIIGQLYLDLYQAQKIIESQSETIKELQEKYSESQKS